MIDTLDLATNTIGGSPAVLYGLSIDISNAPNPQVAMDMLAGSLAKTLSDLLDRGARVAIGSLRFYYQPGDYMAYKFAATEAAA